MVYGRNFLKLINYIILDEPIGYMEDCESVTSFNSKGREFQLFAIYDGHGGRDPKTGIKKGGKEVASWCVNHLPTIIKDTLEKENYYISNALIESFEKADKGKSQSQLWTVSVINSF